jgi:hypothetical protein
MSIYEIILSAFSFFFIPSCLRRGGTPSPYLTLRAFPHPHSHTHTLSFSPHKLPHLERILRHQHRQVRIHPVFAVAPHDLPVQEQVAAPALRASAAHAHRHEASRHIDRFQSGFPQIPNQQFVKNFGLSHSLSVFFAFFVAPHSKGG